MAVIDFDNTPSNTRNQNNSRRPFGNLPGQQEAQPDSQIWMNVGYYVNGSAAFINLPYGVAIDTMRPADTRGSNEDFVKQRHASNGFLKQMQQIGASLQPGETRNVMEQRMGNITMAVQLRRVKAEMQVRENENEYSIDLASFFQDAAE